MTENASRRSRAPRLAVLLASEAPVAVVLRRGPSKMVRVIVWNRATDKLKPGSWFKGRIYEDRSDLSPDGRHFLYFATGGVAWAIPATGGTWTAISALPSLKAIALWGQGDTWSGGGIFTSNTSFSLDADDCTVLIRNNSGFRRDFLSPPPSRMERDGWTRMKNRPVHDFTFEKTLREGWILRKLGRKLESKREPGYELEQPGECKLVFPSWEWADWDRQRLVWAEHGCIRAAKLGTHKLGSVQILYDFNGMVPVVTEKHQRNKPAE